jgi:hypothetical protein
MGHHFKVGDIVEHVSGRFPGDEPPPHTTISSILGDLIVVQYTRFGNPNYTMGYAREYLVHAKTRVGPLFNAADTPPERILDDGPKANTAPSEPIKDVFGESIKNATKDTWGMIDKRHKR